MSPIDTDLESRLRRNLQERQAQAPSAPVDLADRVRRRSSAQRRARAVTALAAVAVVAVLAGASTLALRSPESTGPDAAAARTVLGWPTRGSLAGEQEWLDGVRRLDWQIPPELSDEIPEPSLLDRHVAYAGEVPAGAPNGLVALVVGEADGRLVAAWFTGYPGATPAEMQLAATPQPVSPTAPQAYVGPVGPTSPATALVVVARPDATLDITAGVEVDAGGAETRPRIPLETADGTYAEVVDPLRARYAEIRSTEPGGRPYVVPRTVPGDLVQRPGDGEQTDASVVEDAVERVSAEYGLLPQESRSQVLATGDAGDGRRAALIGATFPSGATGVWLLRHELHPGGVESSLGRLPHAPAGTPLEERLVGVPVDGYRIAVHAPAGAVRAEALTREGRVLGSVPLTDGAYVGAVPGGGFAPGTNGAASLRALDAAGAVLAEEPIGRLVAG